MPTPQEVFANPKFQALSPADKIAVLRKVSPDFAKLSPADQQALVAKTAPMGFQQQQSPTFAGEEGAGPRPGSQVPDVTSAGGVVGQFAGGAGETLNPINIVKGLAQAARQSMPTKDLTLENAIRVATGPMGMLARPTVESTGHAAKWYWDALRGRIPYAYEQALTAAPEALGQGAAQAFMMRGPIESLARTDPVNALARYARLNPAGELPLRPGPLPGVATRSRAAFDAIENKYANVPVSPLRAMSRSIDAVYASQHGFSLPPPVSQFLEMMKQQNGQLSFKQARLFEKAFGERIEWEGKTDFMDGLMKQIRDELVQDNTAALDRAAPGTGRAYQLAKAQWERAQAAKGQGANLAGLTGLIAGHEIGSRLASSPLIGMSVFGPLFRHYGRALGEGTIGAVTDLPKPFANIPGTTRLTPFAAGFTAPVRQPPQDEEEQ